MGAPLFGIVLIGLTVIVVVALSAALFTDRPSAVRWYRRERVLVPGGSPADGYRDPPSMDVREIAEPVTIAASDLPAVIRHAATACRLSFTLGAFTLLPIGLGVLLELLTEGPQPACVLGVPHLALSFAQLAARHELLSPDERSHRLLRTVAIWTLVHGVVVCGAVLYTSSRVLPGMWQLVATSELGWVILAHAALSFATGAVLLRASRRVRDELTLLVPSL